MLLLERVESLLERRGIVGHRAADRFVSDFKAYLIYFDTLGYGNAEETLDLLEDANNLTDSSILMTNFSCSLDDLISPVLKNNKIFMSLFDILIDNNGKGVGAGELALPLILSNYRFSNDSDGEFFLDGQTFKVELKKDGASLKPVKTGLTHKGIVDELNAKYFNNTVPGKKSAKLFEKHLSAVSDPYDYKSYFKELYVGCDTSLLSEEVVAGAYKNPVSFNNAVGKFALKEYKKVDGWNNIVYINADKRKVVNICNVDNIEDLNLKFSPVMRRGNDTQAIADGYVNVSI